MRLSPLLKCSRVITLVEPADCFTSSTTAPTLSRGIKIGSVPQQRFVKRGDIHYCSVTQGGASLALGYYLSPLWALPFGSLRSQVAER